ncbi:hypothetical protein FKG96_09860 [Olivibacter sp. LS-1]|uniref:hypothetical protein n=1 Tax=Olivibacter sp. LS-1 TaxID=2592345 RepID=UPI0011EAB1DA|nr:hypothetical protein [Olivibacter sp. LS-1]QEL01098.1 hypothetical protein FKG96_09860 [Olivibacter sp. LS-1]
MERDYAVEYGVKTTPCPISVFEQKFGYGTIKHRKNGVEVRVNDLDKGIETARKVIFLNNLPLMVKLSGDLAVMRSFMVVHREEIS